MNAAAADALKQTPIYQMYTALAPRPQDWGRLVDKMREAMKQDYNISKEEVAPITAPTLIVAGDADIFPPSHAVEVFALFGGGQRDGGWDGSGRSRNQLAILPGLTHYTIFSAPALAETAIAFLDMPAAAAPTSKTAQ